MATVGQQLLQSEEGWRRIDDFNSNIKYNIDIDSDGYLVHPTLTQNNDTNELQVGEYINCSYSYSNGFTNFRTGDDLNFICVERTEKRSILVSDTVIPNLSFNEINQKGFIYGNVLEDNPLGDLNICTIRSLNGGSANNNLSEYDKYIVNFGLENLITPSDKNIWHWDIGTITSSTPTTDSSKIVTRGITDANTYTVTNAQNTKAATIGFRPVLVIDHLYAYPTFEVDDSTRIYDNTLYLNNIGLDATIDEPKVKVEITNTNNDTIIYSSNFIDVVNGSLVINTNFNTNDFELNKTNILKVNIIDENEYIDASNVYLRVFVLDGKFILFKKAVTTDVISNKLSKDSMFISVDTIGNSIITYLDGDSYRICNNEENVNIIGDTRLKIFYDDTLNHYGVCFN